MKSQFARIKNRASSVSTRALAVMLCFVMLLTAVGAGTMMTAIASGGAATPVTDAAQKVIDIADSVDVPAAKVAEDEAPTDTVFDKLKKQLSELASADADDEAPAPKRNSAELAETGDDPTYYMHIGVGNAFTSNSAVAFTYDSSRNLYYASYTLAKNSEYPMVINTTSNSLDNNNKPSSSQSVTSLASSWNPQSIQFDYFSYTNYSGYDCFKFKTQTTQTVYFTFTTPSAGLVVRSSLDGVTPETPTESSKVYFAKPAGWTNAYVYFYKKKYWDSDKGTGSATSSGCLNYNGTLMTQDAEYTDYYSATIPDDTKYIAFADQTQSNYGNFHQGGPIKVAIKITDGDRTKDPVLFDATTPIYTPDTSSSISLNSYNSDNTTYYLSGTWSALPTEASSFYYNSYETSGSPSSTRYGQQMTEGKINGVEFSYYHVEGRTETDQLFTVSYGDPAHNGTVYFRTPDGWSDKHGWDSSQIDAAFYASDGEQCQDWSAMTSDGKYGNDRCFKISIPKGARYVQFRGRNDDTRDGNNCGWPYTAYFDLNSLGFHKDCIYISSYGVSDDGKYNNLNADNRGNTSKPIADGFYEYFGTASDSGQYTNNFTSGGFNRHGATRAASHNYIKPDHLGEAQRGDYYVLVLYKDKTYTINGETKKIDKDPEIIWMPKLPGTEDIDSSEVNVYGKDGPIVIDWKNKTASGATTTSGTAYGYSLIADTKLYDSDGTTSIGTDVDDDGASYEKAKVVVTSEDSADIVIKTTIDSDYTSKYYLKGWCINGVTYACGDNVKGVNDENAGSNGVYTMTYTIPAGTEDSAKIEITPIYYLRSTTDTITFYLEGYNTVVEKWGNTPYIYPFYGNLNNVANSFGVYPGQPMVYAEGKYSTQIPLKDIPISGDSTNTAIKGITINNGYADHVHRNMIYKWTDHDNDAEHKQTYDYDDFYKIYNECLKNGQRPNSIIFRIQDETTTYNRSTYGGTKSGARVAESKSSLTTADLTNINNGNGWEVLRNRYDQPIDLFGDVVSEPSGPTSVGDNVRVVSTGYNANIAGDYGTAWKVYKKGTSSYSLIKDSTSGRYAAPPSIFLLRGNASGYNSAVASVGYPEAKHEVTGVGSYTDSISKYEGIYKAAYGDNTVKGKPVYITYEKDAQDTRDDSSGTGAYRLDGRWYYTHAADSVHSTVGIEYWDNTTATWKKDTVTASNGNGTSGGTNKNNVKFDSDSYAASDNVTTSKATYINNETPLNFTATAGTGYIFEGWYIKYSDTSYDKIVGAAEAASIKATANYELVARFLPIVTGSLTIDHKLAGSSTGEGTVDMTVIVKDGDTEKATYTGSHVYIDGTYISNSLASYTIDVTLKTTPQYDGKVSAFGYDKFNTKNSITATTSPTTLPGAENGLTTSHFTFTVGQLYSGSSLSTSALNYTSTIDATPHYYSFVYNLTTRDNQSKSYTAKGEISLKDYKQYVGESTTHALNSSFVKAKAPFESNFLKKNTLPNVTPTYTSSTHTFSATSTFEQQADIPTYTVRFKLPYDYYLDKSGDHKKYTVNGSTYKANKATFDLLARYDEFVTVDATETKTGSQDHVSKSTAVNHTDNDFITAPDQVGNKYFSYWSIKRLADTAAAQATAPEVARIYYPDFHYRIYGDYYVEAVFADTEADSWHNKYVDTNDNGCSILYIGDSRNQWNDGNGSTDSSASVAADKIYSDFIFNYRNDGVELKNSSKVKIGMIIERVVDNSDPKNKKWAVGSTNVSDMSYYETVDYGSASSVETVKADILSKLVDADSLSTAEKRTGCVYIDWNTADLNNKNNLEENYSIYSAYGQTVGTNSIEFSTDNKLDTYVYRAYAVMKYDSDNDGTPDKWCISDPAYFCMRYTANLKYSE